MSRLRLDNRAMGDVFAVIVDHALELEGGYVCHPDDPGGETRFGISKRSHPDLDIAKLTRDDAMAIYQRDYWRAGCCEPLPPALGCFLFDSLVQHRPRTAKTLLQDAVGVKPDGLIGPVTLAAAKAADPEAVLIDAFTARALLYHELASQPSRAAFAKGWFARLAKLQQFIYMRLMP